MQFLSRAWKRLQWLYRRALTERATPREVAFAVGVGTFVGCTPAIGFHGGIALAVATLLRLNRLYTWLGSRICNVITLPFVVIAEIEIGHFLRIGAFVALSRDTVLTQAPALLGDWLIGLIPIGGALACVFGLVGFALAKRRERRQRRNLALAE